MVRVVANSRRPVGVPLRRMTLEEAGDQMAPSGVTGLQAAKLAIPQVPPGMVVRQRLLERLDAGAASRLTLVCAGPGWGKTMLVAGWAARSPARTPVAWVSLDRDDNDPVLFWTYVLAAVRGATRDVGTALRQLTVRSPVSGEAQRRIVLGLAELPQPVTLVLDDLSEIQSPDVLGGLRDLVRHPSPLRLVLITRSDPALHLYRLRVSGQLSELRATDLAFTWVEAAELLHGAGVQVAPAQQQELLERTEGWAAGLRLAVLSADGRHEPAPVAWQEEFEGSVAEYLFEEVLSGLSGRRREFLLHTSVADELNAELADLLSGQPGGQQWLEDLEQANAFVVALGPRRDWFRYHALMTDLLRQRLLLEDPRRMAELQELAARWFAAHGDPLAAVRHAIRGQHWQLVGELMTTVAASRVVTGERHAFRALLAALPASELSASPELRACGAILRFLDRDYPGFALQVAEARAMHEKRGAAGFDAMAAFLSAADMVLARLHGDMPALLAAAGRLLDWLSDPPSSPRPAAARQFEAPALANHGVALVWCDQPVEAEPYLRSAVDVATAIGAELTVVNSLGYLALGQLARGSLSAATEQAQRALELADECGCTEMAQSLAVYLVLAETHFERADLAAARHFLDRGLAAQAHDPEWLPYIALQALRARLLVATGDVAGARALVTSIAVERRGWTPPPRLQVRLAAVEAEIRVAQGLPAEALDVLAPHLERTGPATEELTIAAAWAELALGDFADAERRVTELRESACGRVAEVEAWLVRAVAADHDRDDHQALRSMARAMEIAEPDDIRRPFLRLDTARVPAILRHLVGLGEASPFTESVVAQLLGSSRRPSPRPPTEPLTDRETVVLSHMALLQTNEEIAAELYVSVNTVKAHARAVYRKLAVSSRREAVNRSRELGLI